MGESKNNQQTEADGDKSPAPADGEQQVIAVQAFRWPVENTARARVCVRVTESVQGPTALTSPLIYCEILHEHQHAAGRRGAEQQRDQVVAVAHLHAVPLEGPR
jgi:hypothetical protein